MRHTLRVARFWSKIDKSKPDGCWPWTSWADRDGYGRTKDFVGERIAHRIAWTLTNGPIPVGRLALHRCDNPPCCNPAHLFLGTEADNMRDRHEKGRYAVGRAHHWHSTRSPIQRGERCPTSKLKDAQVAAIRAEFVDRPGAQTVLAKKYGVSVSLIHLIVRNKTRVINGL